MAATTRPPKETKLDSDVTKPSTTAPGDGPADTTDPTEHATSVTPQPGAEAVAAGTVNAVKPIPAPAKAERDPKDDRFETYEAVNAAGKTVKVKRNIDTGESELV